MSAIECFWTEPTGLMKCSLRQYSNHPGATPCPVDGNWGYHQARVQIEDRPVEFNAHGFIIAADVPLTETRWPTHCACGYQFTENDNGHLFEEPYFRRLDTGEILTQRAMPAGAMWDAPHMKSVGGYQPGPDGLIVVVRTPGGDWCIDSQSDDGGRWTRTGAVPKLTVRPSIIVGEPVRYHGLLTEGVLRDA